MAEVVAKIDVQQNIVTDLDKRLGQLDGAVNEATRRGRTNSAMNCWTQNASPALRWWQNA